MKSKIWLSAFLVDSVLELLTNIFPFHTLHILTKPLLMLLLIGYFMSLVGKSKSKLKTLIILALVMSWLGDCFLLFQEGDPLFFILGLVSFLLAHLAYIFGFLQLECITKRGIKIVVVTVFLTYAVGLVYFLWPGLGELKIPVVVYAMVLTTMGITGVIKNSTSHILVSLGVVFFVASDSILAYNKFFEYFPNSGVLIMLTYISAQWLIVEGLSNRILERE